MPSISQNQGQSSQSSFGKNLSSLLLQVPILIILVKNLVDTHFLGVLLLSLYANGLSTRLLNVRIYSTNSRLSQADME